MRRTLEQAQPRALTPWTGGAVFGQGARYEPRRWQVEACAAALGAIQTGTRGVIQAIMGAGKSALISELARLAQPEARRPVVITTPTVALVDQLADTVTSHCLRHVGRFYTHGKEIGPIVVVCNDSMEALGQALGDRRPKLLIADECHRSENQTFHDGVLALHPQRQIGLSATPFLAEASASLSLWDREIYRYGAREALADGVVVPWRIVPWTGGEIDLDDACMSMMANASGPGVVNAPDIASAEAFAARITDELFPAAAVHSRMRRPEVLGTLQRLETGDLRAVVHCSLLQEGVDFPWLRWLCLRRAVRSRVRFAQEVGRALRAYPGKEYATLYDPNDLFGALELSYEACLGGDPVEPEPPERKLEEELLQILRLEPDDRPMMAAQSKPAIEAYLRQLSSAVDAAGIRSRRVQGRWRRAEISPRQLQWIELSAPNLRGVPIPPNHLASLRMAWLARQSLTRGGASDFLTILFGLNSRRVWPERLVALMADSETPEIAAS